MADVLVVDRKGLARKLGDKPKAFIIYELLQNAWDEDITRVDVTAEMLPGRPTCRITIEDDCAEGFADLRSAYTMFRDSKKAPDPTKRGRFELGEKLVLALALKARIITTTGTVIIEGDERQNTREKRETGTLFEGEFRMTRAEFDEMIQQVRTLLPPTGCQTTFNGEPLNPREMAHRFETTLQTIRTDEEGNLKPTYRKTEVRVYEPRAGENGTIYEMGIPVVETGDRWHYDVQQRVPVNWERNNVPPSYLKTLRVEVLNAMHDQIDPEEAATPWVTEALTDERCGAEAADTILDRRFGEKRVIFDPSDPEGTKIAASKGYTVIPGGALPKGAWDNVRRFGTALPAGQVTPSPKPYDPNGRPEKVIPEAQWTDDQRRIAAFAKDLFKALVGKSLWVVIVTEPMVGWGANFGNGRLCLNYGRLGKSWFAEPKRSERVLDLLLHEFVHHTVSDHLSDEMHKTATRLGAKLVNLALDNPKLFEG